MRRIVVALIVLAGVAGAAHATGAATRTENVTALAVLHEHVDYERQLLAENLARLSGVGADADAHAAAQTALGLTAALDAELGQRLQQRGYSPARARALWQQVIGDGAPPPGRVLLYVCSIHATESDRTALATAPPGTLGTLLGNIELTLLLEGRQLAAQLGGATAVAAEQSQRDALHALAPMLIPTDRAFAASA